MGRHPKHLAPRSQSFFQGAAVLTAATFIVKFINIFFSLPLANSLGSEGMGYFYTAYDIFIFFSVLGSSGTPVAISRLVSVAYARGKKREADKIFRVAFLLFSGIGLFGSLVMFFFARALSGLFVQSDRAMYAIMALAPMSLFMCMSSCLRGYFQGRSNMTPTAVSQIIESLIKLVVGLGLAGWFMRATGLPEFGSAGAIAGVSVGAVFAFVYILVKYPQAVRTERYEEEAAVPSAAHILKSILTFAVPVIVGSSFLSLLDLVDAAVMMDRLQGAAGIEAEAAVALKGQLGNARKYFDLPNSVIVPISITVLPQLAGALAKKDGEGTRRVARTALHMTVLFALPCAAGLCVFSRPICRLFLYNQPGEVETTALLLAVMAPGVVFASLLYTTNSMLQAVGKVYLPILNMCIGTAVRIAVVFVLCGIPEIHAVGSALSTPLSYMVMIVLNLRSLHRVMPETPGVLRMCGRPLLATAIMLLVSVPVQMLLSMLSASILTVVPTVLAAVAVYAVAAVKTGALTYEEILQLPKGNAIARVLIAGRILRVR